MRMTGAAIVTWCSTARKSWYFQVAGSGSGEAKVEDDGGGGVGWCEVMMMGE